MMVAVPRSSAAAVRSVAVADKSFSAITKFLRRWCSLKPPEPSFNFSSRCGYRSLATAEVLSPPLAIGNGAVVTGKLTVVPAIAGAFEVIGVTKIRQLNRTLVLVLTLVRFYSLGTKDEWIWSFSEDGSLSMKSLINQR